MAATKSPKTASKPRAKTAGKSPGKSRPKDIDPGFLLPPLDDLHEMIEVWVAEDVGIQDLTTNIMIPKTARADFVMNTRQDIVVAGIEIAAEVFRYMVPRIVPTLIPQLVALIPAMVFLEATLGILKVYDPRFPTWGRVIYEALSQRALWGGSLYWVLEPLALLLMTGLAFALLGFALERILNPRLQTK